MTSNNAPEFVATDNANNAPEFVATDNANTIPVTK